MSAMKLPVFLALPLLAMPAIAQAQAYQCRVPQGVVQVPRIESDGPARPMAVTGYTLALSWSPEYCRGRGQRPADRMQCSGRNGRFGFIVHGLWPEGGAGRWPQWCANPRQPSSGAVRPNLCITPSARLLAHEWAKHGSCMVKKPETYFKVSRILWNSLRIPDFDRLSHRKGLTAGLIRKNFADANPGLEPEHIGLELNRKGWLKELKVCYGKGFMPARCGRSHFGPRANTSAKIWRGL